jgi:hypothetical protein
MDVKDQTNAIVYYRVVVTPGHSQVVPPTARFLTFSFTQQPTCGELCNCLHDVRTPLGQDCFEILHLHVLAIGEEALIEDVFVSCAGQIVGSVICVKQCVIDNSKE